ncbi:hypothetical protein Cpa01nite_07980 [Cellulomonas pakistanensis]|uniref:Uncharacterized protein n=1 Tax=Cellulomonas pakistanensis TaxID=992287 RepID=A0A919PBX6_9CELL|nr:hypothetical protein Cpa01nite_07980 [Cellulomonas pakistanensis]
MVRVDNRLPNSESHLQVSPFAESQSTTRQRADFVEISRVCAGQSVAGRVRDSTRRAWGCSGGPRWLVSDEGPVRPRPRPREALTCEDALPGTEGPRNGRATVHATPAPT